MIVCIARKGLGDLCQSDDECQSWNCEGALAERYCTEAQQDFVKEMGELCDYDEECKPDLYCRDGACAPAAAVGDDRTLGTPRVRAAYCLEESCVQGVALGGACESSDQCAVGVCDGGTCQKALAARGGPASRTSAFRRVRRR